MCQMLQHDGLTGLRRRYQQTALAFADRRDHINDATGNVLFAAHLALQQQWLVRVQRGQVFKQNLVFRRLWRLAIHLVDFDQCKVALTILRCSNLTLDRVASVQVEAAYLRRRNINIVC